MRLSVIVPCGSTIRYLPNQLYALAQQRATFEWEIIVSDNNRTPNPALPALIARYHDRLPNLRVASAPDRRGPAHARNAGARAARADSLAFVDADDEVGSDWVQLIAEAIEAHGFVASQFDFHRLNPEWNYGTSQDRDVQKLWYPPYLLHAGGSGLGVHRKAHEAIGGFDESWPRLEDTDYCIRMQLAGNQLHFAPGAIIYVRMRTSLHGVFAQARSWGRYNMLLYCRYGNGFPPVADAWRRYWKGCRHLVRALRAVRSPEGRMQASFSFGWQLGLLEGCARYRIPPMVAVP